MIKHNMPCLGNEETERIREVIKSGWVAAGEQVKTFEKGICDYIGLGGEGAAVSSGTSALHMALLGLGVGKGDEVIAPTYVCSAIINAINYVGAMPVVVDVNESDFNISKEGVEKKISNKTKAIIVPHIYGMSADIEQLNGLGVPVIEDCAQSLGSKYKGKHTGTFGVVSIFSFYATKMITTGYGGMVVSKDEKIMGTVRDLINFDCRKEYKVRYNYYMSDVQAAMGVEQLKKLPGFVERRRKTAERYKKVLAGKDGVTLQECREGGEPNYYRFVCRFEKEDKRNKAEGLLKTKGIETSHPIRNEYLLHNYLKLDKNEFQNAENISKTALSIPVYPALKDEEISTIEAALEGL